jgi:hypothetical protein
LAFWRRCSASLPGSSGSSRRAAGAATSSGLRDARLTFVPKDPQEDFDHAVADTGRAFLELPDAAGIQIDGVLIEALLAPQQPARDARPPGISHARLVERFGPVAILSDAPPRDEKT